MVRSACYAIRAVEPLDRCNSWRTPFLLRLLCAAQASVVVPSKQPGHLLPQFISLCHRDPMKISSFILSRLVSVRTRNLPQIGRVWWNFSHDDLLWDSRRTASFPDNGEDDPSGQYRLLFLEVRHITFLGCIASSCQRDTQAVRIQHSTDRVRSRGIAVYREQWRAIVAYGGTTRWRKQLFEIPCFSFHSRS